MRDLGNDLDFSNVFELLNDDYSVDSQTTSESGDSLNTSLGAFKEEGEGYQPPAKKRRKSSRPPVLVPRLLLGDIRRSYMTMFVNTLNTHDFALFYEFLFKYCAKSISYHQEEQPLMKRIDLNGLALIGQLFYNRIQALPDGFHTIPGSCQVITRPGGVSEVVSVMHFYGTKIFDVDFDFLVPSAEAEASETNEVKVVSRSTLKSIGAIDGTIGNQLMQISLLSAPEALHCCVQFSMSLNSNKEIERLEFTLMKYTA